MTQGPLAGVKVLEASQIVAGPFCGMVLADLGADVVKLESPQGDEMRRFGGFMPDESKNFHALNRGKRSLVLDLGSVEGRAAVLRLIRGFDIFVINSRPGVAERLGIDYETLITARPDLIYIDITGFGQRGPSAHRSGSDVVSQAYSGLMAGDGKVNEWGAPERITATAVADFTAGLSAAVGACAALVHRDRCGEGQYVSTSLLRAAVAIQGMFVSRVPVADAEVADVMLERVRQARTNGGTYRDILQARGGMLSMVGRAHHLYSGGYETSDGAIVLGALTPANRAQIRSVLGIEGDPTMDPDFNALDPANDPLVNRMRARIQDLLRQHTTAHWIERFDAAGAPAAPVNMPEEIADDPQIQAMGLILDVDHELTGPERIVGPIVEMTKSPTGTSRPAPVLGRHTADVLSAEGFTDSEVAALLAALRRET